MITETMELKHADADAYALRMRWAAGAPSQWTAEHRDDQQRGQSPEPFANTVAYRLCGTHLRWMISCQKIQPPQPIRKHTLAYKFSRASLWSSVSWQRGLTVRNVSRERHCVPREGLSERQGAPPHYCKHRNSTQT